MHLEKRRKKNEERKKNDE